MGKLKIPREIKKYVEAQPEEYRELVVALYWIQHFEEKKALEFRLGWDDWQTVVTALGIAMKHTYSDCKLNQDMTKLRQNIHEKVRISEDDEKYQLKL